MPHLPLSRRALLAGTASALGLAATGCGRGRDDAEPGASAGRGGYPLRVEHRFGVAEIPAAPQRIVTVGATDMDAVLALGAGPRLVGTAGSHGGFGHGVPEWSRDLLGGAMPRVLPWLEGGRPDLDVIASLEPDLVLGLHDGLTREDHDALAELAPTVARPEGPTDGDAPWEGATPVVGRALDLEEEAEALVAAVAARFAEAAAAHPDFRGASAVVAERSDRTFTVLSPADPRSRFLEALGFEVPEEVAELVGDAGAAPLAEGELGLLDRDLLVWNAGNDPDLRPALAGNDAYQGLGAVERGRDVIVDDGSVAGALAWSTVLSLPYALDRLVPRLAAAVDGDPATPA